MLDSLRQARKSTCHCIGRGWREMFNRGSDALAHFPRNRVS